MSYWNRDDEPYSTRFDVGDIVSVANNQYMGLVRWQVFRVHATRQGSKGQLISLEDIDNIDVKNAINCNANRSLYTGANVNRSSVYKAKNFTLVIPAANIPSNQKDEPEVKEIETNENDVAAVAVHSGGPQALSYEHIRYVGTMEKAKQYVELNIGKNPKNKFYIFKLNTIASLKPIPIDWEEV